MKNSISILKSLNPINNGSIAILKSFNLLILVLFTSTCFAQFGKLSYELDGLNKRNILNFQASTDIKSALISYSYIFPLANLSKPLLLDFNFGGKFGLWIDKRIKTGVNSIGFIMIPIGTGLTYRAFNPVNFSIMGGVMAGFKANDLFSRSVSNDLPDNLLTGGWYLTGSIFVPLRNRLALEMGYDRIFLPPLNKLSYIHFGVDFGNYEY